MAKLKWHLVLIFLFLFFSTATGALDSQKKISQYIHQSWGTDAGLPQAAVTAVLQTGDGRLWLGTTEGLVCFDGILFEVYDTRKTEKLPDNYITALLEDRRGNLWIGTMGGLSCRSSGVFFSYTTDEGLAGNGVTAIHEDRQGNIRIGTIGGLSLIDPVTGTITSYTSKDGLADNNVRVIHEDRQGNLWIGTFHGLSRGKPGNKAFIPFTTADGLSGDGIFVIYEDSGGSLWIAAGNGLTRYNPGDGTFTPYTSKDGLSGNGVTAILKDRRGNLWIGTRRGGLDLLKEGKITVFKGTEGLAGDWIMTLYEDSGGNLWAGTKFGGLNRYNPKSNNITSYTPADGLAGEGISYIYEDREGSLWLASLGTLSRLRDGKFTTFTRRDGLVDDTVNAVYEDHKGSLWFATKGGVSRLRDGEFTSFTTARGLPDNYIRTLYGDREGSLWFGSYDRGLSRLENGEFTSFTMKDGLSDDMIIAIYEDRQGNLWVGTSHGLNRRDNRDGSFTVYTTQQGLSHDRIYCIREDRDGNMWIGTFNGLNRLEPKTGKITTFTQENGFEGNRVKCIHQDGSGDLWLGTVYSGLFRMDLKDETFDNITTGNGLPDDNVTSILEDDSGNLWLGSIEGVFRVDKNQLLDLFRGKRNRVTAVAYNEKDGMKDRYCNVGGWKSRDGKLWFPTNKGGVMIDPNNVRINRAPLHVRIGEIIIDGKKIQPPAAADKKKLTFSPGTGRFEVRFDGVSLLAPDRVRFRYILDGLEKQWHDAGIQKNAYYPALPPGKYTFRVNACNSEGIWSETGSAVSFYLKPYFYRTTWFYLLCALVIAAIGFTGYRYRVRNLKVREKKLEKLVAARTRDLTERNVQLEHARGLIEAKNTQLQEQSEKLKELDNVKSRFFANISHEFRTPLTLIMGPLEQMINGCPAADAETKRKLTMMLRNAQRLLRLINQLLELSKLDSGKMKLRASRAAIVSFVKGITSSFQLLARQKELELKFREPSREEIDIYFDPRKMEVVMSNLLVNALKFTPAGGNVTVAVDQAPGSVVISVSDTGPGIPNEKLAHIFDRFYQADSGHEYREKGSGIGLALSRELVQLHHGVITAASPESGGCEFTVTLPLGDAHLTPAEIQDGPIDVEPETFPVYEPGSLIEEEEHETETAPGECEKDIILVVEDSADLRQYMRSSLEPVYTVSEAADGKQGIKKAREIIPDLIISDIMMPETGGYELCRELKNDVETCHIPIILLTAKASEENILEGLECGADDYITKPFNTGILCARIKNLIDIRSRLQTDVNRQMSLQPVKTSLSGLDQTFLKNLNGIIEENLPDEEFNVDKLCEKLNMSRATLYRKVQALSSLTPNEFIRSNRLKRAAELLKQRSITVLEVALEVGFGSSSYFSKCFKNQFHLLPSEYQSAHQI